jgi:hypothetical protein
MPFSISAAALGLAVPLFAQNAPVPQPQLLFQYGVRLEQYIWQLGIPGDIVASSLSDVPLITGRPYSGTGRTITYSPDGKNIDRSDSVRVYRDDQGRTRRESNGGKNISIMDPVAGLAYTLSVENKTVLKRPLSPTLAERLSEMQRARMELVNEEARLITEGGRGGAQNSRPSTEDLGTHVVNGVSAQGARITKIIPTGTFGNDHDIKTSTERWVSNDLHVLVKSVYTDSRTGATVYDLLNIIQAAPDPALFQVPAGYTVQEGGRGGRGGGPVTPPSGGRGLGGRRGGE